jgi:hypothetical protein
MNNTHSNDTENKTNIPDNGVGAMMGEDEYVASSSSSDIAKMASGDSPPLKPKNVLTLQRQLGNQATLNIINRTAQSIQSGDNAPSPFAGLKMVMPKMIQREDEDSDNEVITRSNAMEQDDESDDNPDAAVELDGSDNEVQQDSNEIDQTIAEAQQLPSKLNGNDNNYEASVSESDDDDNVDVIIPMDSDLDDDNNDGDNIIIGTDEDEAHDTGMGQSPATGTSNVAVDMNDSDEDSDDSHVGINAVVNPNQGNGFSQIASQKKHKQKKGLGFGGHKLASESLGGAAGQTVVDTARNASTVVQAAEATSAIKSASSLTEALTNISDTSTDAGSEGISGLLGKVGTFFDVPPMNVILPIATLIFRIMAAITKHKHMKAFKAMMGNNGGDVKSAKKRSTALADKGAIGAYGFAKTKRGFWLRIIKAAINVGNIISRLVTIISGGTAALISEAVNTALSLSNGVIKVGQSLKGIYKMIIGKRGKRRNESANWIVDGAIDGDKELLQFMIDGQALSKTFLFMRDQKYKDEMEVSSDVDKLAKLKTLATRPKTTDEMQTYLEVAEELNLLVAVKTQVAVMTKST